MDAPRESSPARPEHAVKQDESLPIHREEAKPTYRSFKKKYRKMRIKFDGKMQESNILCAREQLGANTAKRIAQENDQLLDLLLDVNSSAQIPADKRIELSSEEAPALSTVPPLISADELAEASRVNTPNGKAIYKEILAILDQRASEKAVSQPSKSLALLLSVTHHSTTDSNPLAPSVRETAEALDGYPAPISYLTADQIDDYLYEIDTSLGAAPSPNPQPSPNHELALRNPHSVYNWLRRNEPKIFLQDGEGSEKSLGKPGSLRGAGKRASMPGPSKPDALEIVEEDGLRYDPTISGLEPAKGKRKREDDAGYHPKSGAPSDGKVKKPRTSRKKKSEGSGETAAPTSSRKSKAKARNSSPGGEAVAKSANQA